MSFFSLSAAQKLDFLTDQCAPSLDSVVVEDSRIASQGAIVLLDHPKDEYIQQALGKSAKIVLVRGQVPETEGIYPVPESDWSEVRSGVLERYLKPFLERFSFVGATGTNGKTSVMWLTQCACANQSFYFGTLGIWHDGEKLAELPNTTVRASDIAHELRARNAQEGALVCVEVSSIGIDAGRVSHVPWKVKLLTNLERDHLDHHGTIEAYHQTKVSWLFEDDAYVAVQANTYSQHNKYFGDDDSLLVYSEEEGTDAVTVRYNRQAARLILETLGLSIDESGLARDVPGRLEPIASNSNVFVDYAHTPDAIASVLEVFSDVENQLVVLLGCGGDRDRGKRPVMARAALTAADFVVFTSDNPRSEDPEQILDDMLSVFDEAETIWPTRAKNNRLHGWVRIVDRRQAIRYALSRLGENDILVLAGKGHETYQEIKGVRIEFDDRVVALEELRTLRNSVGGGEV